MTIKEKLNHALSFGYPVRVTWRKKNGEDVEDGIVSYTMLNGFNFHNDDRKHDYAYIESVEPLEPEVDRSYPHCDETACLKREGGGLYCKREECDARIVLVDYAGSFREDPKPGEEDPAADDVAKERWK